MSNTLAISIICLRNVFFIREKELEESHKSSVLKVLKYMNHPFSHQRNWPQIEVQAKTDIPERKLRMYIYTRPQLYLLTGAFQTERDEPLSKQQAPTNVILRQEE